MSGRDWAACGASVIGSMHRQRGLGCDDAFSYGIAGDFVVAAVADGAGSVSGTSAWGAYVACQSILNDAMQPAFFQGFRSATTENADKLVRWLFDGALCRVRRQAEVMNLDVGLLATTLCVGVANREMAVFGQVGDGVIAVESPDRIETLLIEHKDEYANTTSFIQSDRALDEAFRTVTRTGVTAFALSTDGMSYKITDIATGQAYEPFFRDCWRHVRAGASPNSFAALLGGIEDDQTGDDKTMVLVAGGDRRPAAGIGIVTDSSGPPPGGGNVPFSPGEIGRTGPLPLTGANSGVANQPISRSQVRHRRWWERRNR